MKPNYEDSKGNSSNEDFLPLDPYLYNKKMTKVNSEELKEDCHVPLFP